MPCRNNIAPQLSSARRGIRIVPINPLIAAQSSPSPTNISDKMSQAFSSPTPAAPDRDSLLSDAGASLHQQDKLSSTGASDAAASSTGSDEQIATRSLTLIVDDLGSRLDYSSAFARNQVSTTKYTFWTFLPTNLWEQFHRLANIWFLIISILQLGTPYSPTVKYATAVPLSLVILITAVKDAPTGVVS